MTTYLRPDDPGFGAAHVAWNRSFEHRPAQVADVTTVADVVAAVRHARDEGLKIAIQATGHGPAAVADEKALLLSLRALDEVTIDADRAVAIIGGGAQWQNVLGRAQDHGLAPLLGSAPHVGAVGYTLGGGFGWLARRHGLAVDHVQSLTVVLADGSVVTASETEHPELFWALLGAGAGSLGVVVEMEIGLVPVTDVYAGNLFYPLDAAADVFDFYLDWIAGVGDELSSAFNVTAFPDLPMVPEPLRGETFTIVRGCYCGDRSEAAALVDRWRAWRPPMMDLFGPMPFREAGMISQDPVDPLPASITGRWLRAADTTTLQAMLQVVADGALFAELRHAGGAIATPNPAASFAARGAAYSIEAVAITPTPESQTAARGAFATMHTAMSAQHARLAGYLNFVEAEERRDMVTGAFDADTLQRLAAIKLKVDPDNLFSYGLSF